MKSRVRVFVMGYGTIGKRVAEAVMLQDDMELVGIGKVSGDWKAKLAVKKGISIYAPDEDAKKKIEASGVRVEGLVEDLLRNGGVDVVVDATPKGVGAKNKEKLYEKYGVKAVFQGGEKHEVAGVSFVAQRNYSEALGRRYVRVVSCNTTAICRVVGGIHEKLGVGKARITIVRRAVDVWESHKSGIINTIVPELKIPSHHGPDVNTVIKDLDITTMALKSCHNLFHIHAGLLFMKNKVSREDIIEALDNEPRVAFVSGEDGVKGLNSIFELARDMGRPRGDLYEIPVWIDSITVKDGYEVYLMWATPNESDVVPENVDAIRAIMELEEEAANSIRKTDESLGIIKKLY